MRDFRTLARTPRGEENLQSMRDMGVDHIDISPNPIGVNSLNKDGISAVWRLFFIGSLGYLFNYSKFCFAPRDSIVFGEKKILGWNMEEAPKDSDIPSLNRNFLRDHDILKGRHVEEWVQNGLNLQDLQTMIYPSEKELDALRLHTNIFRILFTMGC